MGDRNYTYYHQCEEPWGVQEYAKSGEKISKKGCLISCIGMIVTKDPGVVNKWLKDHKGYSGNDFIWNKVKDLGITFVGTVSLQQAKDHFDAGRHVILKLTTNHYVLMTNYTYADKKIKQVKVLDPGYRRITSYNADQISMAKIYK